MVGESGSISLGGAVTGSAGQYSDHEQYGGSGGSSHYHHPGGMLMDDGHVLQQTRDSPYMGNHHHYHHNTVSPSPLGGHPQGHSRAYSPQAMSEPERGPTPPTRGYTLASLQQDTDPLRHYSDTEGAPIPPLRMNSNNTPEQPPSPAPQDSYDPTMDRGIQSSLPSLVSERHRADSPSMSELANYETDLEGGRLSPNSEPGENEPLYLDSNGEQHSCSNSSDDSFEVEDLASTNFVNTVANAAKKHGLTVVDQNGSDSNSGKEKVKKLKKPRERAKRATSPYSTDSNYSSIMPHKPYPKSERRRQLVDQGQGRNSRGSSQSGTPTSQDGGASARGGGGGAFKPTPPIRTKPNLPHLPSHVADMPSYNKPSFPSASATRSPPSNSSVNIRTNPLVAAFDTTDTPIV